MWYFAVILGMGLVVLALSYALRRWSGWRPAALLAAGAGGVALGVAMAPVAWPYFVTRRELGLERSAGGRRGPLGGRADVPDDERDLAGGASSAISFISETTLFPGPGPGARRAGGRLDPGGPVAPGRRAGGRSGLLLVAMARAWSLAVLTVAGHGRVRIGSAWTRLPSVTVCGVGLLACLLAQDALAGWRRWRAGSARPAPDARGVGARPRQHGALRVPPLARSRSCRSAGRAAGAGLYLWLHAYVLPLRAIRGTTRFGLLVLMVVALLAGLGVAWLLSRPSRMAPVARGGGCDRGIGPRLRPAAAPVPAHRDLRTSGRSALRADADDVAVLEWPLNNPGVDVDAKLRSVGHGQRVVNGFAGFVPDLQRELSGSPGRRRAAVRVAGGAHGPGPDLSAALSAGPRGRDAPRPSLPGAGPR